MRKEWHLPEKPVLIGESDLRSYAVAITLLDAPDGEEVLFEVRSGKLKHQPGDICLPGGAVDEGETPEQAVVREITEELLVNKEQVGLIGPACLFMNGMIMIHVFLCTLTDYAGTFYNEEVAEVFRVPLSYFVDTEPEIHEIGWKPVFSEDFPLDKIYGGRNYVWRERRDRQRFYEYDGHVIWGITARIMHAFSEICRQE